MNIKFSAGIHPWYIDDNWSFYLEKTEKLLSESKISAIGECGIDLIKNRNLELQKTVFIEQAKLAEKYNKPLIIHCVKGYNILIEITKKHNFTKPMIFHGFNNKTEIAKKLIEEGFYISFGKSLFNIKSNSAEVLKSIPKDRFFLETDDYNKDIYSIYNKASEILNIPIDELSNQIKINYNTIFHEK
jgi:TatD DNase family protein